MRINLPGVSSLALLLLLSSCELLEDMEVPVPPESCEEVSSTDILICPTSSYLDHLPKYPGGHKQMLQFIADYTEWPKELENSSIEGVVVLKIMFEETGKVRSVEIAKSLHPALDAVAIQVVQKMPNWLPGTTKEGIPIKIGMYLPIRFRLE
jgi:periplasmic protein TonB